MSLYNDLYSSIFIKIIQITVLLFSISIIAINSLGYPVSPIRGLYRIATALTISVFSLEIAQLIIFLSYELFNFLWSGQNIDWYNLFSVTNEVKQIQSSFSMGNSGNQVIDFLFLSGYFLSTLSLLAMLEIRQALILFLVIVLPFFSIMISFKSTERFAIMGWKLLIQISVIPFFVLIVLSISHLIIANFLLQLALLSLASIIPLLFVSSPSIFQTGALSSIAGALSLESIGNRIIGYSSGASNVLGGADSSSGKEFRRSPSISRNLKGSSGPITSGKSNPRGAGIMWDNVRERDFDYRIEDTKYE